MKVLVFDTETTGLVDFKLPADHPQQPHICEVSAVWTRGPGEHETALDTLIQPMGWTVPQDASEVHGITTEMCEQDGVPLSDALVALKRLFDQADRIVGYGVAFDLKLVRGACRRLGMDDGYASTNPKKFDVMAKCTPICKLPPTPKMLASGIKRHKTPNLTEAAKIMLGRDLEGAHQALVDVEATADLYWLIDGQRAPDAAPAEEVPTPASQAAGASQHGAAPAAESAGAGVGAGSAPPLAGAVPAAAEDDSEFDVI